jgi:hypothetical protein
MNRQTAFEILELREHPAPSERDIKKAYRSKILQFHPDKNNSPDAAAKFVEVQEAYTYLNNINPDSQMGGCDSYPDVLNAFLRTVFREETPLSKTKLSELICRKICRAVEDNADHVIDYLRNINRDTVRMIRDILFKYRNVVPFSTDFFERIDEIIDCKYILLNPELEDLFSEENVYVLKLDGGSYLVPLWHHEMTFTKERCSDHKKERCSDQDRDTTQDRDQKDPVHNIFVKNFPILPDNMDLDEFNVLTVKLQCHISELWDREVVVNVGGKRFVILGNTLQLTGAPQRIEYPDCGVPYNNLDNIFDTSKKQPIVFIITVIR